MPPDIWSHCPTTGTPLYCCQYWYSVMADASSNERPKRIRKMPPASQAHRTAASTRPAAIPIVLTHGEFAFRVIVDLPELAFVVEQDDIKRGE